MASGGRRTIAYVPPADDDEDDSDDESSDYDSDTESLSDMEQVYIAPISEKEREEQAKLMGTDPVWNVFAPRGQWRYRPVKHGALLKLQKEEQRIRVKSKKTGNISEPVRKKFRDKVRRKQNPFDYVPELNVLSTRLSSHIHNLNRHVNGWGDDVDVNNILLQLTEILKRLQHVCNWKWKPNSAPQFDHAVRTALEIIKAGMGDDPHKFVQNLYEQQRHIMTDVNFWTRTRPANYQTPNLGPYEQDLMAVSRKSPSTRRDYKKVDSPLYTLEKEKKKKVIHPPSPPSSPSASASSSITKSIQSLDSLMSSLSLKIDDERYKPPPGVGIMAESNELRLRFLDRKKYWSHMAAAGTKPPEQVPRTNPWASQVNTPETTPIRIRRLPVPGQQQYGQPKPPETKPRNLSTEDPRTWEWDLRRTPSRSSRENLPPPPPPPRDTPPQSPQQTARERSRQLDLEQGAPPKPSRRTIPAPDFSPPPLPKLRPAPSPSSDPRGNRSPRGSSTQLDNPWMLDLASTRQPRPNERRLSVSDLHTNPWDRTQEQTPENRNKGRSSKHPGQPR